MLVLNSPKWLINRYFTLTNKNAAFESRDSIKSRDHFFIIAVFIKLSIQIFFYKFIIFNYEYKKSNLKKPNNNFCIKHKNFTIIFNNLNFFIVFLIFFL